jgi:hypothetical protein
VPPPAPAQLPDPEQPPVPARPPDLVPLQAPEQVLVLVRVLLPFFRPAKPVRALQAEVGMYRRLRKRVRGVQSADPGPVRLPRPRRVLLQQRVARVQMPPAKPQLPPRRSPEGARPL